MPSFTFQPGFVPYIRDGIKRHTIRTTLRCKPGDSMNLLTQKCHHIATRPCILVDNVTVSPEGLTFGMPHLHPSDEDEFASMGGFQNYVDMCIWFNRMYGTAYFRGYVHRWAREPERVATQMTG